MGRKLPLRSFGSFVLDGLAWPAVMIVIGSVMVLLPQLDQKLSQEQLDAAHPLIRLREKSAPIRKREALTEELTSVDGERFIALHPTIAGDCRRAIAALESVLVDSDAPEARDEAIPHIRALIHSITLVRAATGRGVEIEIEGRLATLIELATGRPVAEPLMLTLERVKGIEPSS